MGYIELGTLPRALVINKFREKKIAEWLKLSQANNILG